MIRRMRPLGFTLEQMRAAMRDIEVLRDHFADARLTEARARLAVILADAEARRTTLEVQLAMADELIDQPNRELS